MIRLTSKFIFFGFQYVEIQQKGLNSNQGPWSGSIIHKIGHITGVLSIDKQETIKRVLVEVYRVIKDHQDKIPLK